MSNVVGVATLEVNVRPTTDRRATRDRFHLGMAAALLVTVALRFARTLYLRAFLNVPEIPNSLIVHGIVLTAWFGGFFVQTALIAVLSAISIVPPAASRMLTLWGLPQLTGMDSVVMALGVLFLLLVAMAWHDIARTRRVHPLTLIGGVLFLGSRIVSLFVIADSEMGRALVRSVLLSRPF